MRKPHNFVLPLSPLGSKIGSIDRISHDRQPWRHVMKNLLKVVLHMHLLDALIYTYFLRNLSWRALKTKKDHITELLFFAFPASKGKSVFNAKKINRRGLGGSEE